MTNKIEPYFSQNIKDEAKQKLRELLFQPDGVDSIVVDGYNFSLESIIEAIHFNNSSWTR